MNEQQIGCTAPNNGVSAHPHANPPIIGIEALSPIPSTTPDSSRRRGMMGEPWRVAAVIPGFGKHKDVELLLRDMGRLDLRGIDFWVVLVDNATPDRPLSDVPAPSHLKLEHVRLSQNTGGAGGFNAGMRRVLAGEGLSAEFEPPDFVWLVDSDARVSRRCLRELVRALVKHKKLCAVGSALVDPVTGWCYEIGGKLLETNGYFVPAARGDVDRRRIIACDYIAACSALVRREAIEKTGLMPEVFIHGDDVEWCLQMTKKTGQRVAGVVASRAGHPLWNRKFQTWMRYFTARNAHSCIGVRGYGAKVRFRRALADVFRAVGQVMTGMDELAELHIKGLEHAAQGHHVPYEVPGGMRAIVQSTKMRPYSQLAKAVREELQSCPNATTWLHPLMALRTQDLPGLRPQLRELGMLPPRGWSRNPTWLAWHQRSLGSHLKSDMVKAMLRAVFGTMADVAIIPTGQPAGWFRARTVFLLTTDGFQIRRIDRSTVIRKAGRVFVRGLIAAWNVARRAEGAHQLPLAPVRGSTPALSRSAAPHASVQASNGAGVSREHARLVGGVMHE